VRGSQAELNPAHGNVSPEPGPGEANRPGARPPRRDNSWEPNHGAVLLWEFFRPVQYFLGTIPSQDLISGSESLTSDCT
jgi:hypothetical protein